MVLDFLDKRLLMWNPFHSREHSSDRTQQRGSAGVYSDSLQLQALRGHTNQPHACDLVASVHRQLFQPGTVFRDLDKSAITDIRAQCEVDRLEI